MNVNVMQESSCLGQVKCNSQFHIDLASLSLPKSRSGPEGKERQVLAGGSGWTFGTEVVDVDLINEMQCNLNAMKRIKFEASSKQWAVVRDQTVAARARQRPWGPRLRRGGWEVVSRFIHHDPHPACPIRDAIVLNARRVLYCILTHTRGRLQMGQ
ncbi:hypothetical protein GALMADRAFT_1205411 [Galerina marginata CBS 339.88]|uniref:Uncharacterized protein n=1 Tax=Galerina marginata (strain CBS 339.88) TaxID=685588 RepID=A0A067SEM5_GALM3|nr:hypothetical protein GALMADRAFT_1205411 [Galerina marginata CBS 339.88]